MMSAYSLSLIMSFSDCYEGVEYMGESRRRIQSADAAQYPHKHFHVDRVGLIDIFEKAKTDEPQERGYNKDALQRNQRQGKDLEGHARYMVQQVSCNNGTDGRPQPCRDVIDGKVDGAVVPGAYPEQQIVCAQRHARPEAAADDMKNNGPDEAFPAYSSPSEGEEYGNPACQLHNGLVLYPVRNHSPHLHADEVGKGRCHPQGGHKTIAVVQVAQEIECEKGAAEIDGEIPEKGEDDEPSEIYLLQGAQPGFLCGNFLYFL